MNGMNGTCPECGAEFAPGARFCPRCGGFAGIAAPGPAAYGPPTATQPAEWPGGQGRIVTVAPAPPGGAGRRPRAALPAALPAAPAQGEPPADATRADWSAPTMTRQPGYPPPAQPFQQPSPLTRAEPDRYQAPLPQASPPPGYPAGAQPAAAYPPTGFAPNGYPLGGYPPAGPGPDRYPQDDFPTTGFAPDRYPQGGYPPAGPGPAPFPQDDFPPTGFAPDRYPPAASPQDGYPPPGHPAGGPGTFEPSPYPGPQSPGGPPEAPRQPPRRHDRDRRGLPVALWIVLVVLLAGGAGVGLKLAHPFSHGSPGTASGASAGAGARSSPSGSPTAPGGGTASPGKASGTAAAATEQQAATSVAALLSQSAADRTATSAAASDIASCGPNLKSDPAAFGRAVSSRQGLLSRLAAVPGQAALPPAVIADLTKAWQASIAADQAYARWGNDEIAKPCVPQDTGDPGYQATQAPNQQATTDKTDFAAAWKPVAVKYALTQYQPGQL